MRFCCSALFLRRFLNTPMFGHFSLRLRLHLVDRACVLVTPQTGIGRTGKVWGYQNFDVEPDVIASAKVRGIKFTPHRTDVPLILSLFSHHWSASSVGVISSSSSCSMGGLGYGAHSTNGLGFSSGRCGRPPLVAQHRVVVCVLSPTTKIRFLK